jgi:hypothetical protein
MYLTYSFVDTIGFNSFENFYRLILLISVVLSFYIFITVIFFKQDGKKHMYTAWQFPMLLAVFLEVYRV